jgi:hypothetical protein
MDDQRAKIAFLLARAKGGGFFLSDTRTAPLARSMREYLERFTS